MSPITVSPDADWGYDVADYCDVQPVFGTLGDLDTLVAEAGRRGLRVLLDLVPNHTSDRHPWFVESRSAGNARRRDWYVWADPRHDGSPPNNWRSVFGGPAWTRDERTGQYYFHNFLPQQPDLNWWNEEVRAAFDDILRFWFDRGIAGFRIDVAHGIVKDRELRDNPPATPDDDERVRRLGQRPVYNVNRPEVHDVLRRWRALSDTYEPPRVLVGETWVMEPKRWARYYGTGEDELHLAFNFPFAFAAPAAEELRSIVETTDAVLPAAAWPVWTLSNHDIGRFPTRMCGGDERKARCLLLVLLTLRGTPVLYYGDEIGMPNVPISQERMLDVADRDPGRTPMQWSGEAGAGFTQAGAEPWLPLGDYSSRNVELQERAPDSMLSLCRGLIELRRETDDLRSGAYASLPSPAGVWAWRRGESIVVAVNLSDAAAAVDVPAGVVRLATGGRTGRTAGGSLDLEPWEGVVLELR